MSSRSLSVLFPPPFCVQRRGWEAMLVLAQDYPERLSDGQRQICAWILALGPERMGWDAIAAGLRMYSRLVETRI